MDDRLIVVIKIIGWKFVRISYSQILEKTAIERVTGELNESMTVPAMDSSNHHKEEEDE